MREPTRWGDGSFVDRLGELVLLSYATGQAVEGSWTFVTGDRMIPDLYVAIDRIDGAGGPPADDATVASPDDRAFDAKLERFLLVEFASGKTVAGTWELRYARAELPVWTVDVDIDGVDVEPVLDESTTP